MGTSIAKYSNCTLFRTTCFTSNCVRTCRRAQHHRNRSPVISQTLPRWCLYCVREPSQILVPVASLLFVLGSTHGCRRILWQHCQIQTGCHSCVAPNPLFSPFCFTSALLACRKKKYPARSLWLSSWLSWNVSCRASPITICLVEVHPNFWKQNGSNATFPLEASLRTIPTMILSRILPWCKRVVTFKAGLIFLHS